MKLSTLAHHGDAFFKHLRSLEAIAPPPIPFYVDEKRASGTKVSKKEDDKDDGEDADDLTRFRTFEVLFDPSRRSSGKYKLKVKTFEDGTPEEWCKLRQDADELFVAMDIDHETEDAAMQQFNVYRSLLSGKAKEIFNRAYSEEHTANEEREVEHQLSFPSLLARVIDAVAKHVFPHPEKDYRLEKKYLKVHLYIGSLTIKEFCDRLEKLNQYLVYFPCWEVGTTLCKPRVLGDDELIEIMDHAKRPQWDIKMLENEKASYNFETYKEIKEYFKQLEAAQDVRAAINETSS